MGLSSTRDRVFELILIKYEWREALCRMNVIPCGTTCGRSRNRLWVDYGCAPPPPVRP